MTVGNGMARVYLFGLEELIALAKSRLTSSLTIEECQKYLHVEACRLNLEAMLSRINLCYRLSNLCELR